jgi:PAS domain S-box-containing protein
MTNPESSSNKQTAKEIEMERLLEELQLHQTELEMQNDELRLANEKLEMQQLKYTGVYDLAPIGFYVLDKEGLVTDVNNVGVELLNVRKSFLVKQKLQAFIALDDRDRFHQFFRSLLNSSVKQMCQLRIQQKDAAEINVQMEGIAIHQKPQLPLQCNITLMDISERVKAEETLSVVKDRLQLSLEASASGTWQLDLDTMVFHMDEPDSQTCISKGSFDGRYGDFINLLHPEDRVAMDRHFRQAIGRSTEIDIVCRFMTNDGSACYSKMRGHFIAGTTRPQYAGIIMNITEKTVLEQEHVRQQAEQEKNIALAINQAEENQRKRISESLHDSVSQLLYGIRMKLAYLPKAENLTVAIKDVYQLLDLAVLETRNVSFSLAPAILADFGLGPTITEMAIRYSTPSLSISTNMGRLNERFDANLEIVLFRIIQELINNCLKHSSATEVKINFQKTDRLYITVSDNGKGFSYADEENSPSGSGLLSIKNRLGFYDGTMKIVSLPSLGTTVSITINLKTSYGEGSD